MSHQPLICLTAICQRFIVRSPGHHPAFAIASRITSVQVLPQDYHCVLLQDEPALGCLSHWKCKLTMSGCHCALMPRSRCATLSCSWPACTTLRYAMLGAGRVMLPQRSLCSCLCVQIWQGRHFFCGAVLPNGLQLLKLGIRNTCTWIHCVKSRFKKGSYNLEENQQVLRALSLASLGPCPSLIIVY